MSQSNISFTYSETHQVVGACGALLHVLGDLPQSMRDPLRVMIEFLGGPEIESERESESLDVQLDATQLTCVLNALALTSALLGSEEGLDGCPFDQAQIDATGERLQTFLPALMAE